LRRCFFNEAARRLGRSTITQHDQVLYGEWLNLSRRTALEPSAEASREVAAFHQRHAARLLILESLQQSGSPSPSLKQAFWGYGRPRVYPVLLPSPQYRPVTEDRRIVNDVLLRSVAPDLPFGDAFVRSWNAEGSTCVVFDLLGVFHYPPKIVGRGLAGDLYDATHTLISRYISRPQFRALPMIQTLNEDMEGDAEGRSIFATFRRAAACAWRHHVCHGRVCSVCDRPVLRATGGNPALTCGAEACRRERERRRKNLTRLFAAPG
jgi:hypothetical protein